MPGGLTKLLRRYGDALKPLPEPPALFRGTERANDLLGREASKHLQAMNDMRPYLNDLYEKYGEDHPKYQQQLQQWEYHKQAAADAVDRAGQYMQNDMDDFDQWQGIMARRWDLENARGEMAAAAFTGPPVVTGVGLGAADLWKHRNDKPAAAKPPGPMEGR